MGSVRHTPFNEEMQTIFETDNLNVLEGGSQINNDKDNNPVKEKTNDEQ